LKYLLDQRLSTIPQHNWVSKLFGYQFSVEFKPGRLNVAADALSHHDEDLVMVHALSILEFDLYDQFCQEVASIPEVAAECGDIEASTAGAKWMVVDDIVLHKGRIFMPSSSATWPLVLEQAHRMGHKGMQKTLNRLRASFYTPHTTKLVQEFIRGGALSVNAIRQSIFIQVVFFSHSPFHVHFGLTLQWILWKDFLK
jgi:hypothetical protein